MKTDITQSFGSLLTELASTVRRDPAMASRIRDAVGIALGSKAGLTGLQSSFGSVLGTAGRRSRRAARSASSFVAANPRQVGLGIGGAAVIGLGLFALAKTLENRSTEDVVEADETA